MEKVLEEKIISVKGTKSLVIGDPSYLDAISKGEDRGCEKDLVFNGTINAAPLGKISIKKIHIVDEEYGIEYDTINVTVVQGAREEFLDTYLDNKYYSDTEEKHVELGCDTASFDVITSFNSDHFNTNADGMYGDILVMKQYYGMILSLVFDADLFSMEEIEKRMLNLFPARKEA